MRGLGSTIALVLVLVGLGAYIYFVESENPAPGTEPNEKVFAGVESGQINEVRLTTGGETTVLVKQDEGWQVTEPMATAADPTESSSLATNIASMEETRVVDENAPDLAPYGLADPRIRIAFKAEGDRSGEVHLGDKTPTQSDVYAMKPGSNRVFLVSSYLETTFDKKPFDLRDKRVVKFERDKVERVEVTRGKDSIAMTRSGSDWTVEQPNKGRADYAAVEGLLTRMSTAGMAAIVEEGVSEPKKYGLESPEMQITLGAGSSQTVLEIGGTNEEGQRYARDRSRNMVFTLDTTLADDLTKPLDDYRKKDLFESRAFNTDRLRIIRDTDGKAGNWAFAKTTTDGADAWTVTPEGGQAADVDRAKMDELLSKLSALRITTFVSPSTRAGLNDPVMNVGVSYDGGKFERVLVGRAGTQHYGSREGESVVGEVDAAAVDAVWTSLDAALVPPPPPTPTETPKAETPKQ